MHLPIHPLTLNPTIRHLSTPPTSLPLRLSTHFTRHLDEDVSFGLLCGCDDVGLRCQHLVVEVGCAGGLFDLMLLVLVVGFGCGVGGDGDVDAADGLDLDDDEGSGGEVQEVDG